MPFWATQGEIADAAQVRGCQVPLLMPVHTVLTVYHTSVKETKHRTSDPQPWPKTEQNDKQTESGTTPQLPRENVSHYSCQLDFAFFKQADREGIPKRTETNDTPQNTRGASNFVNQKTVVQNKLACS